ncbi:hypothetical protein LEP1GSC071_3798 [Leptospira santarosai str. JET]|nr:hypothetical protein LEP1GSC071_3798 [Leptospira santarosai str. JET]
MHCSYIFRNYFKDQFFSVAIPRYLSSYNQKNSPKEIPIQLKERNIARYFIGLCAIYRNSNFKTNVSKVTIQKAFKTRNNVKIVEVLGRTLSSMTSIRKTGSFKLLNFLTFKKQTKIKIFLIRSL